MYLSCCLESLAVSSTSCPDARKDCQWSVVPARVSCWTYFFCYWLLID